MDKFQQLHSGELYDPGDEDIIKLQMQCIELMRSYNATGAHDGKLRQELLSRMLAECGPSCHIVPPFKANWGGHFLHLGKNVYINHGLSLVDDTHIFIGDFSMLGPNVVIVAAGHPILPELRGERPWQYNLPVHIGANCWIGASVTILPGVSIGDNTVIGAGAIVTKDIPANVVALGNPCRVTREIGEIDRQFYAKGRAIDWDRI